jgi:hypothetical protein
LISTIQNGIRRYLFPHSEEFELAATFSVIWLSVILKLLIIFPGWFSKLVFIHFYNY